MGILKEFKAFAMRGNVVDMAIGIVIGAAFKDIVTSLVNNIVMPPVGYLTAGVDFQEAAYTIVETTETTPGITINYGSFINTVLHFLIIAIAIFMVIKAMNRANDMLGGDDEATPAEATTKTCEYCQSEIAIKATRCPRCTSQLASGAV